MTQPDKVSRGGPLQEGNATQSITHYERFQSNLLRGRDPLDATHAQFKEHRPQLVVPGTKTTSGETGPRSVKVA